MTDRINNYDLAAEVWQLHLHMTCGGYRIEPIQRWSPQQDVVGGMSVHDQVSYAFGARGFPICECRPQFQVASDFHLVVCEPI